MKKPMPLWKIWLIAALVSYARAAVNAGSDEPSTAPASAHHSRGA
jgi:hypothetical protein